MPINSIEEAPSFPILGKIRLGVRKEASSGALYPASVEYFVLDDAPGVEEVYGADPKSLDIIFPGDDLNLIIPTWFKMYSAGTRAANGELKGGRLNCRGDGPRKVSEDGETTEIPGVAIHYAMRDPVTRVAPSRACLGPQCVDWFDAKGNPKCKQMMKVICVLPRVSWYGGFEIDTSSWYSIHSFHNQLKYIRSMNNGVVMGIPFRIVREEVSTTFYDKRKEAEATGTQWIMKLKPNEQLLVTHGEEIKRKMSTMSSMRYTLALESSQEKLLHAPMEDHFPVHDAEPSSSDAVATAETLLEDAEVKAAFGALEIATGKTFSQKARLIAIRKKENEPDMRGAVLAELIERAKALAPAPITPKVKPPAESGGIL